MIDQIVERLVAFKDLAIVSPEAAQTVGVAAEAPVLVSPYARVDICKQKDCKARRWKPLIYQLGYETEAHHYHSGKRGRGGVYVSLVNEFSDHFVRKIITTCHTIYGIVKPLGKLSTEKDENGTGVVNGRSEKVITTAVRIYCSTSIYPQMHLLREGLLVESASYIEAAKIHFNTEYWSEGFLGPVCLDHFNSETDRVRFGFTINERGSLQYFLPSS